MSDTAGSRNQGAVDQLLLEAGMDDDGQLRDALLNLRALAAEAPAPSAEIAALMAGTPTAATTVLPVGVPAATTVLPTTGATAEGGAAQPSPVKPADELAARRRAKRRITLTTLSVAASLAAGGAVAAASDQGFRDSISQLNQAVTSFVTGSAAAPAGNDTTQAPVPVPAGPRPSATSSADAVPPAPAPASAPAAAAPSGVPARQGNTPTHGTATQKPAQVPAEPALPTDVSGDVRKGLEQGPKLPVLLPTEIPLPGKTPDVSLK
ncbi:hypothetical protein AB0280_04535 [Pseudarthrobacter sp902506025]|uniref:Anti-sigma-D factor RsdA-like protein n=1 Tax=Pseudarthrobacter defluvii TaxID=410837 RepID=A0ABT9UMR9_9MICC|nr:hypothetical protein [Pseudarthrobacter defluvii]MDQ0119920.1 hypothetical protein [Pseudarthrobacter defluvii]